MARKKVDVEAGTGPAAGRPAEGAVPAEAATAATQPPGDNGNSAKAAPPAFKCGPIPTDKDNSVEAAVWGRQVRTHDDREFTVYSVTVQANWRDADGVWKRGHSFRGSHIAVLAEAQLTSDRRVKVERLVAAVDCGEVVNPDLVMQQIEGGLLFGLAGAVGCSTGFTENVADVRDISELRLPTLADCPDITVELDPSAANEASGWSPIVPSVMRPESLSTSHRSVAGRPTAADFSHAGALSPSVAGRPVRSDSATWPC